MGTRPAAFLGVAVAALGVIAFAAACGGVGGGGSDEQYVRSVCSAFSEFTDGTKKLLQDQKLLTDEEKLGEELGKLIGELASRLSKANPPSDVRAYHEEVVAAFRTVGDQVGKGDFSAFESAGELPEPPQAVQDRLRAVAEKTKECEGLGLFTE